MKSNTSKIYEIDVLEGFKMIPDKSQDLIIADPPYYKAINEKWDKQWKTEREYLDWCRLWFAECVRVLKDTGSFYCYGNFDILSKQKVLIFDDVLNFRQNITLSKGLKSIAGRTSDKMRMFPTASEYLLFYTKQTDDYVKDYFKNLLKIHNKKASDFNKWMWKKGYVNNKSNIASHLFGNNDQVKVPSEKLLKCVNEFFGGIDFERFTFNLPIGQTDVWDFTPDKVRYGHPTQKPQAICQRIIKASSNEGDNVLIPFAGSGSECVACDTLNRNYIAFENDNHNWVIAQKRVEENKKELDAPTLFNAQN